MRTIMHDLSTVKPVYNDHLQIESDKTTSIYNVSTRVLSKK